MPLNVSDPVYLKIACHAAKHPVRDVCGLLLAGEDGRVANAVPLAHLPLNACFLHAALDVLARVLAKRPGLKLVGFYDFEESFPNDEPGFGLQRTLLTSLMALSGIKRSYYIRISSARTTKPAENLQELTAAEALAEFEKIDYRLQFVFYAFESNFSKLPEAEVSGAFSLGRFAQAFEAGAHLRLADFDDHFDDPSQDFMNPHLDA